MEKMIKEFEALLKNVHSMRTTFELALQEAREQGYKIGYTNGKRGGISFEQNRKEKENDNG